VDRPAHNPLYLAAVAVAWVVLIYRDAQRAQRLAGLYARTRHPLVAASLLGTLLSGVGLTLLLVGAYLMATAQPGLALEPRAARTIALGGMVLIVGWAARLAAWVRWKSLYGRPHPQQSPPHAKE